jgi:U3 small nucleolar RNA-associated protein 19
LQLEGSRPRVYPVSWHQPHVTDSNGKGKGGNQFLAQLFFDHPHCHPRKILKMSESTTRPKRKRADDGNHSEARKRKTAKHGDSVRGVSQLEDLEREIAKDPLRYHHNVDILLRLIDSDKPDATENLKVAVSMCRIFSRLIAAGSLEQDSNEPKSAKDIANTYLRHYKHYQTAVVKLLKLASPAQQLPILHLCWKIFEQDAELWKSAVWESASIFPSLLSALIEIPDGREIRNTFVSECMSQCHDFSYYALVYISYVYPNALAFFNDRLIVSKVVRVQV